MPALFFTIFVISLFKRPIDSLKYTCTHLPCLKYVDVYLDSVCAMMPLLYGASSALPKRQHNKVASFMNLKAIVGYNSNLN